MTNHEHRTRIDRGEYERIAPGVVAALRAIGKAVDESGLEKPLTELVKVRASQINGCAFCIQLHLNLARQLGVEAAKLDQLAAWREAAVYSERECAALAWTEALTRMATRSVHDSVHVQLQAQFTQPEIAFLTATIATINAWNRIAGGLQFAPPLP
ncbi:MAG TPA: carboxymuconolactone decarboxylase family protein [Zeimonas sp.]|nr:carboxymuconolactone decarboxylase family protein [Zeimonas sp.]